MSARRPRSRRGRGAGRRAGRRSVAAGRRRYGRGAILGLAHDLVPVRLEHPAGQGAERRMVVDDEHGRRHRPILGWRRRESTGYTLTAERDPGDMIIAVGSRHRSIAALGTRGGCARRARLRARCHRRRRRHGESRRTRGAPGVAAVELAAGVGMLIAAGLAAWRCSPGARGAARRRGRVRVVHAGLGRVAARRRGRAYAGLATAGVGAAAVAQLVLSAGGALGERASPRYGRSPRGASAGSSSTTRSPIRHASRTAQAIRCSSWATAGWHARGLGRHGSRADRRGRGAGSDGRLARRTPVARASRCRSSSGAVFCLWRPLGALAVTPGDDPRRGALVARLRRAARSPRWLLAGDLVSAASARAARRRWRRPGAGNGLVPGRAGARDRRPIAARRVPARATTAGSTATAGRSPSRRTAGDRSCA